MEVVDNTARITGNPELMGQDGFQTSSKSHYGKLNGLMPIESRATIRGGFCYRFLFLAPTFLKMSLADCFTYPWNGAPCFLPWSVNTKYNLRTPTRRLMPTSPTLKRQGSWAFRVAYRCSEFAK